MTLLDSFMDLTFTVKDLIIIMGVTVPMILGFVALKWRVNTIEGAVKLNSKKHSDFKDHVYKKFDEQAKTEKEINEHLHKIELCMSKLENNIYKSVLDAIGKLFPKSPK